MRSNDESVEPRVTRELNADRWWLVAIRARLVEQLTNGAEMRSISRQRGGDGVVELGRGEALEELIEASRVGAQVAPRSATISRSFWLWGAT